VQSPTYVLMKKYKINSDRLPNGAPRRFGCLVHIDAYRLEEPAQWEQLRPQEFLSDPANLVVVEWPERVVGHMPMPDLTVTFSEAGDPMVRDIVMDK